MGMVSAHRHSTGIQTSRLGSLDTNQLGRIFGLLDICFPDGDSLEVVEQTFDTLAGNYNVEDCWVFTFGQVAVAIGALFQGMEGSKQITIFNLCVHPSSRGCGIAGRLLRASAEFGRDEGCEIITGSVLLESPGATALLAIYSHYGALTDDHGFGSSGPTLRRLKLRLSDWFDTERQWQRKTLALKLTVPLLSLLFMALLLRRSSKR